MSPTPVAGGVVHLDELKIGPLLAEGGEGRVFQLPRQPHLVYKAYRRPAARAYLEEMVAWPSSLKSEPARTRVRSASAWPCSVVAGPEGAARGLLMPRAPRRFTLRHRDGHSRPASLSYLTSDPGHRAAAYGLELPPPASPARVGLVYALARLLDVFESAERPVGHGDLSTKNVLWSLQRGPEVFVIDCDNAEIFGPDGAPMGDTGRRRAMTPNWDDPAVPRRTNPTAASDRYSLALIFLRLVGAANFPIQARQRAGGPVRVDFPVPSGAASTEALLDPGAPVWDLCARALSVEDPGGRPPAHMWVAELERLLKAMGQTAVIGSVRRAQAGVPPGGEAPPDDAAPAPNGNHRRGRVAVPAGPVPGPATATDAGTGPGTDAWDGGDVADVEVVPVRAPRRAPRTWSRVSPSPRYTGGPPAPGPGPGGFVWRTPGPRGPASATMPAPATATPANAPAGPGPTGGPHNGGQPAPGSDGAVRSGSVIWPEIKLQGARFARWWLGIHVAMIGSLLAAGQRRAGIRSLAFCLVVDVVVAAGVALVVAMIAAPVLGV